jgi:hypothetical protein
LMLGQAGGMTHLTKIRPVRPGAVESPDPRTEHRSLP